MGRHTTILPKAPFGRLLIKQGAKRVSDEAMEAFSDAIMDHAEKIAARSVEMAKHTGRKTVHGSDIKLAAKQQ